MIRSFQKPAAMGTSSKHHGRGIAEGAVSFLTLCDFTYRWMRNVLERTGWLTIKPHGPGRSHLKINARVKVRHTRIPSGPVPNAGAPGAATAFSQPKLHLHKLRGSAS